MDGCFSVAFDFGALALSRSLLLPRLSAVSVPMLIPFPFSFSLRRGQTTLRHRFLPSTTLPPTDPPTFNPKGSPPGTLVPSTLSYADFTLRHLAWNHPTVPFDFAIRNNILPEDVKEVEKGEFEDEKARAASELKLREDKLDLKWVNQSEFVDVYTGEHKPMSRSYVKLLGDMTDPPSFLLTSKTTPQPRPAESTSPQSRRTSLPPSSPRSPRPRLSPRETRSSRLGRVPNSGSGSSKPARGRRTLRTGSRRLRRRSGG